MNDELRKNKYFQIKKTFKNYELITKNYDLVFNCDPNNQLSRNFFYKKIDKNYKSFAYATIIHHKKVIKNDIAKQVFTKNGPFAYLPISQTETSIVYSVKDNKNVNLEEDIKKYNSKYLITKIEKPIKFELRSSNLRSYYHKNILAFGDTLHKLHPLAGQGFNMSIRDIREILKLIKFRINLGLPLICLFFQILKIKLSIKILFFSKYRFIHEFLILKKFNITFLSKSVKFLGENKLLNKSFKKIADQGFMI